MSDKTILTYITDEKNNAADSSGTFADGVRHILDKAGTVWLPALGYSQDEIDRFTSDALDIIAWAEHHNDGSFSSGVKYASQQTLDLLDYSVLYVVEGMADTDLEGMVFAVCTTEESAQNALKQTCDGEDVCIRPIIADSIILDGKVVRTDLTV